MDSKSETDLEHGKLMSGDGDQKGETSNSVATEERIQPLCFITVEPVLLVVFFTQALTGSVTVNLLETVACLQDIGLDKINCTQPLDVQVELLVQPKTAYLNSCIFIVQAVIPSILSLFIGPWSDQNGRKPYIVISLAGFTFSYVLWGLLVYIPSIPIWYYVMPAFIVAATGGNVAVLTCANCYVSDISTPENRAKRLTVISNVSLLGTVSGYLISAEVFSIVPEHGYEVIFFSAAFVCMLCLIYTTLFVREIIPLQKDRDRCLLNPKFVKQILSCVTVKEHGYSRLNTVLLMSISFFMHYLIQGEASVKFLAVKKSLGWTLQDFNIFSAVTNVVCVITCSVGIYVLKKIRMKDLWITLLAASIWCLSDVLLSFAKSSELFWLYSVLGSFAALLGPTVTAEMSKSVPKKHLGKLFALDATVDSLTPFTAPPVYAAIYTFIYVNNALFIYLISAGFAAIMGFITMVILLIRPSLKDQPDGH